MNSIQTGLLIFLCTWPIATLAIGDRPTECPGEPRPARDLGGTCRQVEAVRILDVALARDYRVRGFWAGAAGRGLRYDASHRLVLDPAHAAELFPSEETIQATAWFRFPRDSQMVLEACPRTGEVRFLLVQGGPQEGTSPAVTSLAWKRRLWPASLRPRADGLPPRSLEFGLHELRWVGGVPASRPYAAAGTVVVGYAGEIRLLPGCGAVGARADGRAHLVRAITPEGKLWIWFQSENPFAPERPSAYPGLRTAKSGRKTDIQPESAPR